MTLTALQPRRSHILGLAPSGFHKVVYWEWGAPDNPRVALCVHGLSRNGRDFDVLADALSSTHRVIAVDMPGRGQSDWLAAPSDYAFPTYLASLAALIARSGAEQVDWIGTSMGGLLGIVAASQPQTPVRRLVVNDVGPAIEAAALARIADYLGRDVSFATYAEIEQYIRTISAPFGPLGDQQWAHLTRSSVRQRNDGRWRLSYDPAIAIPFRQSPAPVNLWPLWDAIACPTLLLHGAQSDLLTRDTALAMASRGPKPQLVEFEGVGHAPMLLSADQIDPVLRFLRAVSP